MTLQNTISVNDVFDPQRDLKAVRIFLDRHGHTLANAAHLLGGVGASARVFLLLECVGEARKLTRMHRGRLMELHRLLRLEDVGHPERIETALFAEIHPASSVVEEICVLADSLSTLLLEIGADDPEPAFDAGTVFGALA